MCFLLVRYAVKDARRASRMLSLLLSVPLLLYSLFVTAFAVGYYATPLSDRLSLEEATPNAENLASLAIFLAQSAENCAEEADVTVGANGSRMPFSYAEMNQKLIAAYDIVEEKYGIVSAAFVSRECSKYI